MKKTALIALAIAQFVMVLDQSVMNVSISQLVADFDTTVPTIQAVITLYCLVMAMLMLTGGNYRCCWCWCLKPPPWQNWPSRGEQCWWVQIQAR